MIYSININIVHYRFTIIWIIVSRWPGPELLLMAKFLLHRFISVLHKSGIKRRRMRCNDSVFPRSFHNSSCSNEKCDGLDGWSALNCISWTAAATREACSTTPDNKFNAFHFTLLCAQFSLFSGWDWADDEKIYR